MIVWDWQWTHNNLNDWHQVYFLLLLSRVDFKTILFMRHISQLKAAQRDFTDDTDKKKAGREMQIDLKQENKQIHFISKKRNGFKSSTARPMCSFLDINLSFRQMWLSNRQMRKVMEAVQ